MTWFKPAQQSYDMIFVDTEDQCHGICGGRQSIYTCGCTNSIFLQECMANFHVHAVLSLPSRLGAPHSHFLELGLGYFCIGLSISRRREWLCLEFVKRNIDQAAEFLLVGLIIGYIWCMYSRYFKMVANDMIQACTAKLWYDFCWYWGPMSWYLWR